jgi:hypothetical protein
MRYFALAFLLSFTQVSKGASCSNPPNFFLCNFDYEPVVCTAWSYRDEPLDPPIVVEASNTCFADMTIDSKICALGLDPQAMWVSDVTCKVIPHE